MEHSKMASLLSSVPLPPTRVPHTSIFWVMNRKRSGFPSEDTQEMWGNLQLGVNSSCCLIWKAAFHPKIKKNPHPKRVARTALAAKWALLPVTREPHAVFSRLDWTLGVVRIRWAQQPHSCHQGGTQGAPLPALEPLF